MADYPFHIKGIRASRILALARTIRCARVEGGVSRSTTRSGSRPAMPQAARDMIRPPSSSRRARRHPPPPETPAPVEPPAESARPAVARPTHHSPDLSPRPGHRLSRRAIIPPGFISPHPGRPLPESGLITAKTTIQTTAHASRPQFPR